MKGKTNAYLTVLRTLLKYIKLTATAMVCRRIAASVMSPRHWRETEMAMSQRGKGPQKVPSSRKTLSSREDKSDQALLHFSSGGRERGGGRGGRKQWFVGRWSREE